MRRERSPFVLAIAVAIGLSAVCGACGPAPGGPIPTPTTACGEGDPPADGADVVMLGRPNVPSQPLDKTAVPLETAGQGGQHVFIGVRLFSTEAITWVYEVKFNAHFDPSHTELLGGNTVPVGACASGWTETAMPVFLDEEYTGPGTLRLVAKTDPPGKELTAQADITVQ